MKKNQLILLYVIAIVAVAACFFIKPIRQNPAYHAFADANTWLSIPNFWNIISNIPFVVVGIAGLMKVRMIARYPLKPGYVWFFVGILLTGFGSGYYHWTPNSDTLVWDRVPMTISFMSFLSVIVGEFIDANAGKKCLYPLLIVGLLSIANWVMTDDLRMYALVQFLPIVLILIILMLSKKEQAYKKYFWMVIASYAAAKFFEYYDLAIYRATHEIMSGHALKHIAAAFGPYFFYRFMIHKFTQKNHAAHS